MTRKPPVAWLLLFLLGCNKDPGQPVPPVAQARPDLAGEPLDQVLLRVKQEVGLFQSRSAEWHEGVQARLLREGVAPQCGTGDINFDIRTVRMEFATVLSRTASGEVGLRIPFGPAGTGSARPDVDGSFEYRGTSTLDYTYYVPEHPRQIDPASSRTIAGSSVIEPTLSALRDGLVRAAAQLPCMTDTPEDKDDTFTFSVELARNADPHLGFDFQVVSASAGVRSSRARTNTITVTFHPTPTGAPPR